MKLTGQVGQAAHAQAVGRLKKKKVLRMYPPPPDPIPYFVAIIDLLGYKDHLSDENGKHKIQGLTNLYEVYYLLLYVAGKSTKFEGLKLLKNGSIISINEAVDCIVASDTIMLWEMKEKAEYFVAAVAKLIHGALGFGAPLRGAIAFGDCIIDKSKNIIIGYPIIEACKAEKLQDWIGVGVLREAAINLESVKGLVDYPVPIKRESENYSDININHAIAWNWAEDNPNDSVIYLERQRASASIYNRIKYDNALSFVHSIGSLLK
jgi:hypothetical protein